MHNYKKVVTFLIAFIATTLVNSTASAVDNNQSITLQLVQECINNHPGENLAQKILHTLIVSTAEDVSKNVFEILYVISNYLLSEKQQTTRNKIIKLILKNFVEGRVTESNLVNILLIIHKAIFYEPGVDIFPHFHTKLLDLNKQLCKKYNNIITFNSDSWDEISVVINTLLISEQYLKANSYITKNSFVCEICWHIFKKPHRLKTHYNSHTGERPFVCTTCGNKFTSSSTLKRHHLTHTEKKPFTCQICNRKFRTSTQLKRHADTHIKKKPFVCITCNSTFTNISLLKRHIRACTNGET